MTFVLMDGLLTGHPDIDGDHGEIIDSINALGRMIDDNHDPSHMAELLSAFIQLCEDHFRKEEHILKDAAYPQLSEHARFHDSMLTNAQAARVKLEAADTLLDRRKHLQDIIGFLIDDIMRGDMAFVSYLQMQGLARERG